VYDKTILRKRGTDHQQIKLSFGIPETGKKELKISFQKRMYKMIERREFGGV
jgi:hypothetical protein